MMKILLTLKFLSIDYNQQNCIKHKTKSYIIIYNKIKSLELLFLSAVWTLTFEAFDKNSKGYSSLILICHLFVFRKIHFCIVLLKNHF